MPMPSVTVQTMVVERSGKSSPANVAVLLKLFEITAPGQLSPKAVGLYSPPCTV